MKEPATMRELALSVVLPVYNESGNLETFIPELSDVLRDLGRSYEIIAMGDSSADPSVATLRRLKEQKYTYLAIQRKTSYIICANNQHTSW